MDLRYRVYAVRLLPVLLPSVAVGLLGYQWLRLDWEAEARWDKNAAVAEAAKLRTLLSRHLAARAEEAARAFAARKPDPSPFAPPPPLPKFIQFACLIHPGGELAYPDYEAAYRQEIGSFAGAPERPEWLRVMEWAEILEARGSLPESRAVLEGLARSGGGPSLKAWVLLRLGRLALRSGHLADAESYGEQVLDCCASARNASGASFALSAASQIAADWERRGQLQARFPELASRLEELLRAGAIGHPQDLRVISDLVRRVSGRPATALLEAAEREAERIRRSIETSKRLGRWVAGLSLPERNAAPVSLATFWNDEGQPQLAGVYRSGASSRLVVLFATGALRAWFAERADARARFEAAVVLPGEHRGSAILKTALFPETPALELALHPAELGPAAWRRSWNLFAGTLAATLLLVVLAGYFGFRDVSRQAELASMRATLVSGVTHVLKTPLTSIRFLAETLRLGQERESATGDQLLRAVVEESGRLARLVDNVLCFSRIQKGEHPYRRVAVNLTDAVNAAVERLRSTLDRDAFRLHQESDGEPAYVFVDADGLSHALLNLLDNAVKYSGSSRDIRLGVYQSGKEVEIRVTDHGIGVPASEQQRIFESFYRGEAAASQTAGAGLGLALVRHFAEAHDGRITVESEPGRGSAFSLWLPLMKNHGADPPH